MFSFPSNRVSKSRDLRTTQDEEASSSLKNKKRNEVEEYFHEVECNSTQGGCIGRESNDGCTSSFLVTDLRTTAKDVGICGGEETYFALDTE